MSTRALGARRSLALTVALALFSLGAACAPPPSAPLVAARPAESAGVVRRELGPLISQGYSADRASWIDAPVQGDGRPDYAFRVRVSGDVVAMSLASSDAHGTPVSVEVWDTFVGEAPIPASLGEQHKLGGETIQLGVTDAAGTLLNPAGTLPPHRFDDETLTIYAPDAFGLFRSGRVFTLLVVRPDGAVDRSTVVIL